MLFWVSFAAAAPLATCPRTFTSADLIDAAHRAEQRFGEQDGEGFDQAKIDVETRLVCTSDPLSPSDVVTLHRVHALAAFLGQDDAKASAAVAGMLVVSPSATFPLELVPEGSKLAVLVETLSGTPHAAGPALLAIPDGWIEVNGAFAPNVSDGVAATLQRFDNQGVVTETRFWWPGESLGDWEGTGTQAIASEAAQRSADARKSKVAKPAPVVKATPAPKAAKPAPVAVDVAGVVVPERQIDIQIARDKVIARRVALVSATGLSAIATTVVYALAAGAHEQALDAGVPEQQAEAYRDQANGLTYVWIGTSVLTGGLLATVAITW